MRGEVAAMLVEATAAGHAPEAVQVEVLRRYMRHHNLAPVPGSQVAAAMITQPTLPDLMLPESHLHTTDDLVRVFEMLVPSTEAKRFGAYYTPAAITHFMARRLLDRLVHAGMDLRTVHILDPAVGCGALLIAAGLELATRTGESLAAVSTRLTGYDLAANSVTRAALLFEMLALSRGEREVPQPNLHVADGLAIPGTFQGIIANPPYVRFQVLTQTQRADLAARWETCQQGNFNLYYPFIEASRGNLVPGGAAVFITPNAFLNTASGEPLRAFLAAHRYLSSVLDFDEHHVFEVSTYTCISEYVNAPQTGIVYRRAAGLPALTDPTVAAYASAPPRVVYPMGPTWHLTDRRDDATIAQNAANPVSLADLFQVRYGVATLRDRLYTFKPVATSPTHYTLRDRNGVSWEIERASTLPYLKVSDIRTQADLDANTLRIIYPYTVEAGVAQVIPESEMAARYPGALAYLSSIRQDLAARDHGKKVYPAWYAYGRTQGLIPAPTKLVSPLYARTGRFMLDTSGALVTNGVMLVPHGLDTATLARAQEYLNGPEVAAYMLATSKKLDGGFAAYQRPDLLRLRLPAVIDTPIGSA